MNKKQAIYVATGAGIGVAGVLAYLATRTVGPVPMPKYTECREGPLQEHLVTREQLGMVKGAPPADHPQYDPRHNYPNRVAPGITDLINRGFSIHYKLPDSQAQALPAEAAW